MFLPNGTQTTTDDGLLQSIISSVSLYWLKRTGYQSLNTATAYNEWYDGSGTQRLFLRNTPIVSVQSLVVNGQTIMASVNHQGAGYVIDQGEKALVLLRGVSSTFDTNVLSFGIWLPYFTKGIQTVNVQYTAGFNGTPYDIQNAAGQHVAAWYQRRQWIDQQSQNVSGVGTTTYHKWPIPPEVEQVIQQYTRYAVV